MKPWREIVHPHRDVRENTFLQSEFAADITAVMSGKASDEYQDAKQFFARTYLTEGMRLLLTQVGKRLCGQGGEPVIQLQTAFGGGKTHTLLAVWHLATRKVPLSELAGVPHLLERAGLADLPTASVVVIDGSDLAPGKPWKSGRTTIRTLWGELAWQLGKAEAFEKVKEADASGTSPGKEVLRELIAAHAPCVILLDELAVYIRQFAEGQVLSGGTFDSQLSFLQSLTEAVRLVPNAVLLASLPDSRQASSGDRGAKAITAMEHIFGRVQALWKPVAAEEAFEIVRRRLFDAIRDEKGREAVCRAFADAYKDAGTKVPAEAQEGRYFDRLMQAYPIHPEVFDRLYEDWTTIEGFQRTRGVLKLMAKVIHRLWVDNSPEPMILPGSLPLYNRDVKGEMTYLLTQQAWDSVVDRDIDGERAETTELELKETRFGQVQAARRVARTLFLGSAPSSVATKPGVRGLDRARVMLGCLQPGQPVGVYSDALNRLVDRLHYLNTSGDKTDETTRFWFDTRANLRREMEERKRRFDDITVLSEVRRSVEEVFANVTFFDGVHVFTPHGDVRDDDALRLVVLPPDTAAYSRDDDRFTTEAVLTFLDRNGDKLRARKNRLLFVAADHGVVGRLKDAARVALAWQSIVEDIAAERLIADRPRERQAKEELTAARKAVPKTARECFKWLLCPVQDTATSKEVKVEAHPIATSGDSAGKVIEAVCKENGLVITEWSPIHLRSKLREIYWRPDAPAYGAAQFWEDTLRYLYLDRLRNREVLARIIRSGAASEDFFGIAQGQAGQKYEGFQFGTGDAHFTDTLLLIDPDAARAYALATKKLIEAKPPEGQDSGHSSGAGEVATPSRSTPTANSGATDSVTPKPKSFSGSITLSGANAKARLSQIADEVLRVLASDPTATVTVTLEIAAEYPDGASDSVRRTVSENTNQLGFKRREWE